MESFLRLSPFISPLFTVPLPVFHVATAITDIVVIFHILFAPHYRFACRTKEAHRGKIALWVSSSVTIHHLLRATPTDRAMDPLNYS